VLVSGSLHWFGFANSAGLRLLCLSAVLAAAALNGCSQPDEATMQPYPLAESVLLPGEEWRVVSEDHVYTDAPAVDRNGAVYFSDVPGFQTYRENPDGSVEVFDADNGGSQGMMFGADGLLYTCSNREGKFITYSADGSTTDLYVDKTYPVIDNSNAEPEFCNDMVITSHGDIYYTDRANRQVLIMRPGQVPDVVASGYRPNGIILSPDESTLYTTDSINPRLWVFTIRPDGTLEDQGNVFDPIYTSVDLNGQPIAKGRPGTDGMTVDSAGRVYVTAFTGIHVYNPDGSIVGLIPRPDAFTSNITLGGPDFNYLYSTGVNKVYKRKLNAQGAPYFLRGPAEGVASPAE
jgi:gluconolactonase